MDACEAPSFPNSKLDNKDYQKTKLLLNTSLPAPRCGTLEAERTAAVTVAKQNAEEFRKLRVLVIETGNV